MTQKILIILLIFLGVILRAYKIDKVPVGLFQDEVALAVNAKTIAESGTDEFGRKHPFGFESFSDYKLPGYIYLSAIIYEFLGPNTLTIRLASLLASLLSIPLIGYLTHALFPKRKFLPYLSMFVLALSPYHIHFSRIAYETMLSTMFLMSYLIALIKLIQGCGKVFWIFIGVIALILSSWTYPAARFIIPVLTLVLLAIIFFTKPHRISRKNIIFLGFIFFITIFINNIPFILNPEIDKRPLQYVFNSGQGNLFQATCNKITFTFLSWLRTWNFEFLFLKGDYFGYRHGTKETGLFLSIFVLPLVAGIIYVVKKFSLKDFSMMFILLLLIITGLPSALTNGVPYGPRLLAMIIPLSMLIALGIETLLNVFYKLNYKIRIGVFCLSLLILFYQITHYAHIYFVHFEQKSRPEFSGVTVELDKYIKKTLDNNPNINVYFLNGNNCLPWGNDVLELWYFANLKNKDMIEWNNIFRNQRRESGTHAVIFESLPVPRYVYKNLILNARPEEMFQAPPQSLLIRCRTGKNNIDEKKEKLIKIYYMYEDQKIYEAYSVSEKIE